MAREINGFDCIIHSPFLPSDRLLIAGKLLKAG
jgi:hypothetical protein